MVISQSLVKIPRREWHQDEAYYNLTNINMWITSYVQNAVIGHIYVFSLTRVHIHHTLFFPFSNPSQKEENQMNNNVSCCHKRVATSDSTRQSFSNVIDMSSNSISSCSGDAKCDMNLSCSRKGQRPVINSGSQANHECSKQRGGGGAGPLSQCCRCKVQSNQNAVSDSGYFSSSGKSCSRDCLMWNSNGCHSSEFNSNEGLSRF